MRTLYRPVGLEELELIRASGMRRFPPRLPEQPIFYPVLTREYAQQIAKQLNTKDSVGRPHKQALSRRLTYPLIIGAV